jgi:hypothetical protein
VVQDAHGVPWAGVYLWAHLFMSSGAWCSWCFMSRGEHVSPSFHLAPLFMRNLHMRNAHCTVSLSWFHTFCRSDYTLFFWNVWNYCIILFIIRHVLFRVERTSNTRSYTGTSLLCFVNKPCHSLIGESFNDFERMGVDNFCFQFKIDFFRFPSWSEPAMQVVIWVYKLYLVVQW